ncbi:MAG: ATP-binding cassette domain-containing protein [Chloroflexi bacterium]|nr:ATP-binding cassette domain-containing protein [Chloroflexota bacterium]
MGTVAIQASGLGKRYRIGLREVKYRMLRDSIGDLATAPVRRLRNSLARLNGQRPARDDASDHIWALRDVSFEINVGEVVGVIGRNGAGKSTLLKVLSRITRPTTGWAKVAGRVGSLLEVGTGFHPELTGRENIYLNGAILGMKRTEIERKFDEIVAFAEVAKFVDTPVKRYSSGMNLRLAFAVAAHLEPEILLVDEVLAVGDAAFQKKCLGKMGEVSRQGRTILFVSHNMAAVKHLCSRGLLIEAGRLTLSGDILDVVSAYERGVIQETTSVSHEKFPANNREYGVCISGVRAYVRNRDAGGIDLCLEIDVESVAPVRDVGIGFALSTSDGVKAAVLGPKVTNAVLASLDGASRCVFECEDIGRYLAGGDYIVDIWLAKPARKSIVRVESGVLVTIPPSDVYGTGVFFEARSLGLVPLMFKYHIEPVDGSQA